MKDLKAFLEEQVALYNTPSFIEKDPVSIPHQFIKKQDIEIAGFFAAILAWGNRTAILNSCEKLFRAMGKSPHDFVLHFREKDLIPLQTFVHRTFNPTDLFYLLHFLQAHYRLNESLEEAFAQFIHKESPTIKEALMGFHTYCFSFEFAPERTKKHIATPARNSACKRLNMFLRWMVRKDNKGVDFGIWNAISPHQLICPLDVHSSRIARKLQILDRKQNDWKAAMELTDNLRTFDAADPSRYDFALFGMGVELNKKDSFFEFPNLFK